jgi:hypothetical protein
VKKDPAIAPGLLLPNGFVLLFVIQEGNLLFEPEAIRKSFF